MRNVSSSGSLVAVLTLLAALPACVDTPVSPASDLTLELAKPGKGNGGPSGPTASLLFRSFYLNGDGSVNDPGNDLGADRALADIADAYVDGVDGVFITFESDRLRFQPRAKKKGTRGMFLDLGNPAAGSADPFGDVQELAGSSQLTVSHDLLSMQDGDTVLTPASLLWQQHPTEPLYRLHFGVFATDTILGDSVTVIRTDYADGPTQWTVESGSTDTAVLLDISAPGNPNLGTFHAPFQVTVMR